VALDFVDAVLEYLDEVAEGGAGEVGGREKILRTPLPPRGVLTLMVRLRRTAIASGAEWACRGTKVNRSSHYA
jgi:hypothetical protein